MTFLIVFLIQNTQNHDSKALHLKLDELIRRSRGADAAWSTSRTFRTRRLRDSSGSSARLRADEAHRREVPSELTTLRRWPLLALSERLGVTYVFLGTSRSSSLR